MMLLCKYLLSLEVRSMGWQARTVRDTEDGLWVFAMPTRWRLSIKICCCSIEGKMKTSPFATVKSSKQQHEQQQAVGNLNLYRKVSLRCCPLPTLTLVAAAVVVICQLYTLHWFCVKLLLFFCCFCVENSRRAYLLWILNFRYIFH